MENTYFKMIAQKSPDGKMILVAVVDEDFFNCGVIPSIIEVQCFKQAPNIYTGTYPSIRVNTETITDRTEDLKGKGINGILMDEEWYIKKKTDKNHLGINL
jgi:hypothetical protein